mgnify:CR=1 FL=1
MKLAICAPFMESDLWQERLRNGCHQLLLRILRERSAALPLLWLSDDEKFGLAAFDLGVAMLLPLNCTDQELADGLRRCGVKERWEAMG